MKTSNPGHCRCVSDPLPEPAWKEFRDYDGAAIEWVKAGNVALTPGIVERIGGGASMYVHTRDVATFATAAKMLDMDPRSVPEGRTGANVDAEALLRALVLCRQERHAERGRANPDNYEMSTTSLEPWKTERCPECGGPFYKVAAHMLGASGVALTSIACASDHRWPL